jgi:hypothetical protein
MEYNSNTGEQKQNEKDGEVMVAMRITFGWCRGV